MQLMSDAAVVLGSRHGLMFNPARGECEVLRFDPYYNGCRLQIHAGVRIGERELHFPLCSEGDRFFFLDQRMTPCTSRFIGIDPQAGVKARLTIISPFRPRDAEFSTTPVIHFRLDVQKLWGCFRWCPASEKPEQVQAFFRISGDGVDLSSAEDDAVDMHFVSKRVHVDETGDERNTIETPLTQHDRWVVTSGQRDGTAFERTLDLSASCDTPLDVCWCTFSKPALLCHGTEAPFRYQKQFDSLDAVCAWARTNSDALPNNAARVDGILCTPDVPQSVSLLMAQTLHSWACNTWWVTEGDFERFVCREGSCTAMSTVDVEFTQSPFYLAVWPELLRMNLAFWPDVAIDGEVSLGERGAGTLFLAHDLGSGASVGSRAVYGHHMEVEETTNYLILMDAYIRRTGDESILHEHIDVVRKFIRYLERADTTGNGVPDMGCANTIDDAPPAIQFGKEQVYLAVKTLAAMCAGEALLSRLDDADGARHCRDRAGLLREAIESKGWIGDHYALLMDPVSDGVTHPRSNRPIARDENGNVPGWDAAHIYTENALAITDMVGVDLGLNDKRIAQDLRVAARRCLHDYGCMHSDYIPKNQREAIDTTDGWIGKSQTPGWISMNMLRDIAAFYRGVDLRHLSERYWNWQTTTNSVELKLFFETFNGNNLCMYPRGIAVWGYFDALAGLVIDRTRNLEFASPAFPAIKVPKLLTADWRAGTCDYIES